MHQAEIIVLLLTAVGVLAVLARKIALPYPIVLVLGGLALSFVPRLPAVNLNPDVVFYFILPALIYPAALFTSWRDFRRNLRPILLLAIGLVLATTFAVGSRIPLCRRFHGRLLLPSAQLSPRQTLLQRRRSFAGSAFLIAYR
jgi:NhaP-type Na+/H+ or K+/H+ antiporter